jgi:hypothetical protein
MIDPCSLVFGTMLLIAFWCVNGPCLIVSAIWMSIFRKPPCNPQ